MYVARNSDGTLWLFPEFGTIVRGDGVWEFYSFSSVHNPKSMNYGVQIDSFQFPDLRWEDEPKRVRLVDDLTWEVVSETTHGMTNRELREILSKFPDDAMVAIECCNLKGIKYCEKDNSIRID